MEWTQKKLRDSLPQIFTVIGIVTAIASLSTLNFTVLIVSLVLIVSSAVFVTLKVLKASRNRAMKILDDFVEPHTELEVRPIRNEGELKKKIDLDIECYGEHTVDFAGILMWWRRCPKGSYGLFEGRTLIGSLDIWPISKNTFDRLVAGKLSERDFIEDDLCNICVKHAYWYLGNIMIEKDYRRFKKLDRLRQYNLLKKLIEDALEQWLSDEQALSDGTLEFCALVATPEGESLVKKFGFHATIRKSSDGLPVYTRTTSVAEIRRDMQLLFKR